VQWVLKTNSSKTTIKATDFKFDTYVPRDSLDMTAKFVFNLNHYSVKILDRDMHF